MAYVGYGRAACNEGKRRTCVQCLDWAPVVREIAAAINAKKGARRTRTHKDVAAHGLPLPTFVEVEVRGNKLARCISSTLNGPLRC